MDIHIVYHIIGYTIIFIPLTLLLKKDSFLLICIIILPIVGELLQVILAKSFPNTSYFWFSFEGFDVLTNLIGSLIGIGIARLLSFLK